MTRLLSASGELISPSSTFTSAQDLCLTVDWISSWRFVVIWSRLNPPPPAMTSPLPRRRMARTPVNCCRKCCRRGRHRARKTTYNQIKDENKVGNDVGPFIFYFKKGKRKVARLSRNRIVFLARDFTSERQQGRKMALKNKTPSKETKTKQKTLKTLSRKNFFFYVALWLFPKLKNPLQPFTAQKMRTIWIVTWSPMGSDGRHFPGHQKSQVISLVHTFLFVK